jgi:hypothetical protein
MILFSPESPVMTADLSAPRPCRLLFALPVVVGVVLAGGLAAAFPGDELPDPVPIRRILLPADQLPRELERVKQGVLRLMPRAEFEEKVRLAARAAAGKGPPRLTEARYRATLTDGGLVGSGSWEIVHSGSGVGLFPLQANGSGFNLALRKVRFENRDALVADFDGRAPSLLVEKPGEHTVALEWSARGEEGPDGVRFDLRVPSCAVAVLELDLPADRAVSAEGALVEGPQPAEAAGRRWWKVRCGGRSQLSLLVRKTEGPDLPPPLVQAWLRTTQTLMPEGLDAVYDFDLASRRQGGRELVFECDPELRPYEVSCPDLEAWEVRPGSPSLLTVRLRAPLGDGKQQVQIRCAAPLDPASAGGADRPVSWASPGVRLRGAVPRGETLVLRLHPDLRVRDWGAGDFRLEETASEADAERDFAWQRLTLLGGGVAPEAKPAGSAPRRPRVGLHVHEVEFRARQLAWWQLHPDRTALTLQIRYEVLSGQLFRLRVLLPEGWGAEQADLSPPGWLRNWGVRTEAEGEVLWVDLVRPLTPAAGAIPSGGLVLTARLRPLRTPAGRERTYSFPDAVPLGARYREGALAIDYDEQVDQATLTPPPPEAEPEEEGPWGQVVPDHYLPYRGEPPRGTLILRQRPAQVRARCTSEVFLTPGHAAVETRLLLEAEAGSPRAIDVYFSAPTGGDWDWHAAVDSGGAEESRGNRVRSTVRLRGAEVAGAFAVLGARTPLEAAVGFVARPLGEHWRLTLDRPLRAREPLVLKGGHKLERADGRWDVPLPLVLGAVRLEGEVTLHLAAADLVQVEAVGLREASPAPARGRAATAWRTFRYSSPILGLTLQGQGRAADRPAEAVVDQAALTTYAGRDGVLHHRFTFRLAHWERRTLPARLPTGAHPLAVRIDGHWLPHVPSGEDDGGGVVLELPVPDRKGSAGPGAREDPGDSAVRFELAYETAGGAWSLWSRLGAPAPELPVQLVGLRRTWRLPPGVSPLAGGRFRRTPGPGEGEEPPVLDGRPLELLRLPLRLPRTSGPDADPEAAQALADAAQALRSARAGQTLPLGRALDELLFVHLRNRQSLVVDAAALRTAGVGPETPLAIQAPGAPDDQAFPWEGLGLVVVPAGPAALLTSRAQHDSWRDAGDGGRVSEAVEAALADAVRFGHDPSGRFRSAAAWARPEGESAEARPLLALEAAHARWTEWESVAGSEGEDTLVAVRHDAVSAAGLGVAAALLLTLWATRRRPAAWRTRLLAGAVAAAGLGLVWLPAALQFLAWWPLLAGSAVALVGYLRAVSRPQPARAAPPPAAAAAAAALALVGAAAWAGRAEPAAPAPFHVYLLPESGRPDDKPAVLVPAELLDELEALSRPPDAAGGPVLLDARYEGKVAGGAAEFEAVFHVRCPDDGPAPLPIPLGGVELEGEVWLDGARAHPTAAAPPQTGYVLKVARAGRHEVRLRFRAPVTVTAADRAVRFGVPRLPQSRLVLRLPPGAAFPRALGRLGAAAVSAGDDGVSLEADLGRMAGPLELRWHQPDRPPVEPVVTFRDAYLWELRPEGSGLTGLIRYTVLEGAVTALAVDLPPGLEVRGAEVVRGAADGGGPRLRGWRVEGAEGPRALVLEFAGPVAGELQVSLDLVPREPLSAAVALPVPRPRGRRLPGGSFLGYRAHGLAAQPVESLNVTGREPAALAAFWPEAQRPDAATLTFAASTWPAADRPPLVRVRLDPHPVWARARQTQQTLTVSVGPRQADVRAAVQLAAPAGDLALVEWRLSPGLTITSFTGPEVRRWSQTGDRVLVWLEGAKETAEVAWSGWLPLAPGAGGEARLPFPRARPVSAYSVKTTLRLLAGPGLALAPGEVPRAFQAAPGGRATEQELDYVTLDRDYDGSCVVRPAAANAVARVLTLAEVRDGRLTFTATVDFPEVRGELRAVQLRLRHWEGEEVRLNADQLARPPRERRSARDRLWSLELKPGVGTGYRLQLTGSAPLAEAGADVPMPDVSVPGVVARERLLAVAGAELAAEAPSGVRAVAATGPALRAWPGEAERLRRTGGSAWRVTAPDWRLRLVTRERPEGPAPLRVLLTERSAAVADDRRWLHQAVFWLWHEANADLAVTLPAAADFAAASVDGAEATVTQPEPGRLWLPLPRRTGLQQVRLRWRYAEAEPLDRPNLGRVQAGGERAGPIIWTVAVPPGWEAVGGDLRPGAGADAARALYRAAALLAFSRQRAEGGRGPAVAESLAAAQDDFYRYCRDAGHVLDLAGTGVSIPGPGGQGLREWLRELLAENREWASRAGWEEVRAEAERHAREGGPPAARTDGSAPSPAGPDPLSCAAADRGTPLFGQLTADSPPPQLRLGRTAEPWGAAFLLAGGQWLAVAAVVWGLTMLPTWAARLRPFWPEQVALLGLLGWHLAGPTLAVLFLLVLAAIGRLVVLASRAGRLFHRPRPKAGSTAQARG